MSVMPSRKDVEFEIQQDRHDTQKVMETEWGRRFVARLLRDCRLYQTSFAGQSNQTVFNEGMRNIGLMLYNKLYDACPERLIEMLTEGQDNG